MGRPETWSGILSCEQLGADESLAVWTDEESEYEQDSEDVAADKGNPPNWICCIGWWLRASKPARKVDNAVVDVELIGLSIVVAKCETEVSTCCALLHVDDSDCIWTQFSSGSTPGDIASNIGALVGIDSIKGDVDGRIGVIVGWLFETLGIITGQSLGTSR